MTNRAAADKQKEPLADLKPAANKYLFPSTATVLDVLVLRQLLRSSAVEVLALHKIITHDAIVELFRSSFTNAADNKRKSRSAQHQAGTAQWPRTFFGLIAARPCFAHLHPLADDFAFVIRRLADAFAPSPENGHHQMTFIQVVNSSDEDLPVLCPNILHALARLATLPFVSKADVVSVLEKESYGGRRDHPNFAVMHQAKTAQIMNCLFYTKRGGQQAEWTNSDSLIDIVNSVQSKQIDRYRFASVYSQKRVQTRLRVSTFVIYLIMVVVAIYFANNVGIWHQFVVGAATSPDFTWTNYCADGPTSNCHFGTRSLSSVSSVDEVLRFIRYELVNNLWGSVSDPSQSAADIPFGGAWLVGSLMIRVVTPAMQGYPAKPYGCNFLNLSIGLEVSGTAQLFDCDAVSYLSVPFSYTQDQAFAAVANFTIGQPQADKAVIATYSALDPASGVIAMNEAAFIVTQTGGVFPRARHYVGSTRLRTAILACYVCYSLFFGIEHGLLLLHYLRGMPYTTNIIGTFVKFAAWLQIIEAWALLSNPAEVKHWAEATYSVNNMDVASYQESIVHYLFGGWLLFVIATATTYIGEVQSIRMVVDLVDAAFAPLISVSFVFMVCFMMFVVIAMYIFGPLQSDFATFISAFRVMFPFLLGVGDSSVFVEELPNVGYLFYAIFAIGTSFIAMNIFNGIVMAPLGDLIQSNNATFEALRHSLLQRAKVEYKLGKRSWWEVTKLRMRLPLLPWMNFLLETRPLPDMTWSVLYRFASPTSPLHFVVNSAKQLYDMQDAILATHNGLGGASWNDDGASPLNVRATSNFTDEEKRHITNLPRGSAHRLTNGATDFVDWHNQSLFCRGLQRDHANFGITDTSMYLMKLVMMYETQSDFLREALLAAALSMKEVDDREVTQKFSAIDGWDDTGADGGAGDANNAADATPEAADSAEGKPTTSPTTTSAPGSPLGGPASLNKNLLADDITDSDDDDVEEQDDIVFQRIDEAAKREIRPAPILKEEEEAQAFQRQQDLTSYARATNAAVDTIEFEFVAYFKERLMIGMDQHPLIGMLWGVGHVILVVTVYVYLTVLTVTWEHTTAYYVSALHSGMRDGTYKQFCNDPNCDSAQTYPMSFANGGQYSDLSNFMNRVVAQQIFYNYTAVSEGLEYFPYDVKRSLGITGIPTVPVRWTPAIRFAELTIRMLRGEVAHCEFPWDAPSDPTPYEATRLATMYSTPCYSSSVYRKEPLPIPSDTVLPPSAYQYASDCPEGVGPLYGYQYQYPCGGYISKIHNLTQLQYAASTWLNDPSTRLVVLGFLFYHNTSSQRNNGAHLHDEPLSIQYNMIVELGMGLGEGQFWVEVEQPTTSGLVTVSNALFLMMMVKLGYLALTFLYYILVDYRGQPGKAFRALQGQQPIVTLLITIVALFVYSIERQAHWHSVVLCCLAALLFTIKFIAVVTLPISGIFSRRATTFPRMMWLIGKRFIVVVPFFGIFWTAFSVSGLVMWGPDIEEYATISKSFFTVSQGFFGGWDFDSMNAVSPTLALFMTLLFFLIVVVLLLPTLLSLIVQSAEDANDELAVTNEVTALAEGAGFHLLSGSVVPTLLALWVSTRESEGPEDNGEGSGKYFNVEDVASSVGMRGSRRGLLRHLESVAVKSSRLCGRIVTKFLGVAKDPEDMQQATAAGGGDLVSIRPTARDVILQCRHVQPHHVVFYENWRCPTVSECLQPYLGPLRTSQLLKMLDFHNLRPRMQHMAVAYIISELIRFRRNENISFVRDAEREKRIMTRIAAKSQEVVLETL